MIAQIALFLGSNHAPHQFYGRIILTFVAAFFRFYHHFGKFVRIVFQFDFQKVGLFVYLYRCTLVAQCAHGEHESWLLVNGKLTFSVAGNRNFMSFVLHACIRYGKTVVINDTTCYLLLSHHLKRRNHQKDDRKIQLFNTFHFLYLIIYRGSPPMI